MKILLIVRDPANEMRTCIYHGFGRALAGQGHQITLSAVPVKGVPSEKHLRWEGGNLLHSKPISKGLRGKFIVFFHDIKVLLSQGRQHGIWVLRDKIYLSLFVIILGKIMKRKVIYWFTFPFPENDLFMLKTSGTSMSLARKAYLLFRGHFSHFILYRIVLKFCDHSLTISEHLKEELIQRGIHEKKLTAYPMGIDKKIFDSLPAKAPDSNQSQITICYLGVVSRLRHMDFILDVFKRVRSQIPQSRLMIVGGAQNEDEQQYFHDLVKTNQLEDDVVWTGHLPLQEALDKTQNTDIGISPLEPQYLYNISSPTKVVEYLAMEVPAVVTPIPDSAKLVTDSNGGYYAPFEVESFADAVIKLALNPERKKMGESGHKYVMENRTYDAMVKKILEPLLLRYYTPLLGDSTTDFGRM